MDQKMNCKGANRSGAPVQRCKSERHHPQVTGGQGEDAGLKGSSIGEPDDGWSMTRGHEGRRSWHPGSGG